MNGKFFIYFKLSILRSDTKKSIYSKIWSFLNSTKLKETFHVFFLISIIREWAESSSFLSILNPQIMLELADLKAADFVTWPCFKLHRPSRCPEKRWSLSSTLNLNKKLKYSGSRLMWSLWASPKVIILTDQ